jgi:cytochrome b subunit of formate dehydrogenase
MNAHTISEQRPEQASPRQPEPEWVHRFGFTERFAHWWTVAMVASALVSGLSLGDERGSGPIFTVHVGSIVLLAVGLAGALVLGDHRAVFGAARQLFVFEPGDGAWFKEHGRHPFAHDHADESGMFNPAQKVLAWGVAVSLAGVIVTGALAWSGTPGGQVHGAAVVVAMVLLGAHIFMAAVNPSTRPALNGMVFGRVRRSWAAHHHARWLKELKSDDRR